MLPVDIHELTPAELPQAAAVLGRGMRDNPLHVQAFGDDPARREASLTRFFLPVLQGICSKGAVLGAHRGGALVGVCAFTAPGRCQPSVREKLRFAPVVLTGDGRRAIGSILRWTKAWADRDPREPHWHLGPVAVDRAAQGQGIGGALLTAFCRRMDERRATAYLETDKTENVGFYGRFGFATVGEEPVLDVPNWYMSRAPQASLRAGAFAAGETLAVRRVLETALYCDDLEATARFYTDVLGFTPHFADARLVALDAGGGTVLLLFKRGASAAPIPRPGGTIPPHDGNGRLHVAFAVGASDLDAWEAKLTAAGVAIDGRVAWEGGGHSIYFRDPEGHSVELATPGTWPTY
jgi:catechol 2,3-dioxygenase-like lactoylglutathione lyase family enzyme/ribosomal protein S18 acetylase RimI-like enzyme